MKYKPFPTTQHGSFMLEALIGILIFSLGVLAIIALQANAIAVQSDAQYRIEAAGFADRMLGQINLNVARDPNGTVSTADLMTFNHQPVGAAPGCVFSGPVSNNALVGDWVTALNATNGTGLPGATDATQQIAVDLAVSNRVTITVCWQAPADPTFRFHRVIAYVN